MNVEGEDLHSEGRILDVNPRVWVQVGFPATSDVPWQTPIQEYRGVTGCLSLVSPAELITTLTR